MGSSSSNPEIVRRFIDDHLNCRRQVLDLLLAVPEPRGEVFETMLHLRQSMSSDYPSEAALSEAEAVWLRGIGDPDLALDYLHIWIGACVVARRYDDMDALLQIYDSAVSDDTPPELVALGILARGMAAVVKGKPADREDSFDKALAVLPAGAPRRDLVICDQAIFLAQQGRMAEIADEVAGIRTGPDGPVTATQIAQMHFTNLVETGQAEAGEAAFEKFRSDTKLTRFFVLTITQCRIVLALMQGRWRDLRSAILGPELNPEQGRRFRAWADVAQELLDGNAAEALRLARDYTRMEPEGFIHVGFASLTLIRAELACGNAEAAMRLMGRRWLDGYRNYLDDLFLARAELLRGRREAAARSMAEVLRAVKRYGASGRLDFELRLALELAPGDLLRLAQAAAAVAAGGATSRVDEPPAPFGGGEASAARGAARLVGRSRPMAAARALVRRIAPLDAPVLVLGETGTGKELAARALHEESPRDGEPFVAVNCGAIAESLLESELFGHERGAFTGAVRAHRGIFEGAGRGTVLLDEVGEMPLRLQAALLRVLEAGEIRPVGATAGRTVACRILAATNADLGKLVAAGRFRQDLLFRLKRLELRLPPLRERGRDVLELAGRFLAEGRSDGRRPEISEALGAELLGRS